jgi:Uma2 family endonuclease
MGDPATTPRTSYAEYLAIEEATGQKHEWLDGQVYAMAGGTPTHSGLSGRMIAALDALIGERPCVAHSSDLKLRVPKTKLASYADAVVVCGEPARDEEDPNAVTNPMVIVEVLSDSTERWDRVGKFRHYRALKSLCDYVLVSQHDRHIEVYSRDVDGRWVMSEAGEGESVAVASLGGVIDVDRVYRGIALERIDPSGRPGG